ncbi:MAG: hypothetical protein COA99_18260 [Moraxellaceae bacterium]|nr:MAG: hypothetical protein COA99_18260 [Moraxellaceae bacterium]
MSKSNLGIIVTSSVVGLIPAILMMFIAWSHNSQDEIHRNGVVDWAYLLTIGNSWFAPVFLIVAAIMLSLRAYSNRDIRCQNCAGKMKPENGKMWRCEECGNVVHK